MVLVVGAILTIFHDLISLIYLYVWVKCVGFYRVSVC